MSDKEQKLVDDLFSGTLEDTFYKLKNGVDSFIKESDYDKQKLNIQLLKKQVFEIVSEKQNAEKGCRHCYGRGWVHQTSQTSSTDKDSESGVIDCSKCQDGKIKPYKAYAEKIIDILEQS